MRYSIEQIAALIGAKREGSRDAGIRWLLTDSRSLCFPEETLFFALKTESNDGHNYIDELYRRGVRCFVVSAVKGQQRHADANYLVVPSPLTALQRLAERHRDAFDIPIIGITGSNGKTMVKEWLYQTLAPRMTVTRSPRSYNSQTGVPLSVWLLDRRTDIGIFEAGISRPGEMDTLRDIIRPTIGIMTSLGAAHEENFRSLEEKCKEKARLFNDAGTVIYDSDNDTISRCVRRAAPRARRVAWSTVDSRAAMYISGVVCDDAVGTTAVTYTFRGEEGAYVLPFIDEASVHCSFACATAARVLGVNAGELAAAMGSLEPVAMRLEVKEGRNGCTLINDTYNADINSLDIALDFMSRRADREERKHTLVLSDIRQSGRSPADLYAQVNAIAKKRGVDKLIGIGPDISSMAHVFTLPEKFFFNDTSSFAASGTLRDMRDEIVLIKGSRAYAFDKITEQLEQKVHETILEVDLNALVANFNRYRALLRPETKTVCMVKADAYGAGAVEVAKTLQEHRADYLAVAVADEGVTLRRNGITANIMVMNPEMSSFKTLFDNSLEPEVYSFRILDALITAARREGITGWPVHIKIDSGMHRLGFDPYTDIDRLIAVLARQNAVIPRSVFSHFAGADSNVFDAFSNAQYNAFTHAADTLQAAYDHKILRHIDNTAGIEHFPDRQLDMARIGIGLYGVDSLTGEMLSTVSTLKTTILQLRNVPKGETVGYSRRGVLERDSVIAAIPIGYADGLDRRLGCGRGYCMVNGVKAPYVGNICMDVALADVTGIDCREGDSVTIFGESLPVTVLADIMGTIPYEVLTSVSGRVKKVYFQE